MAAWSLAAAAQLTLAYLDARRGVQAAGAARQAVHDGDAVDGGLDRELERARAGFNRAAARTEGLTLAPVRVLPVVGRQLRSFASLARAGEGLTGAGATAVASLQQRLRPPVPPDQRVGTLEQLGRILTTTRATLADVDLGPEDGLVVPLAGRRLELQRRIEAATSGLTRGAAAVGALTRVLAGDHRYLFLAANNAEMRAGSGMFLEAGILEVREGNVSLGPLRPTPELALPGHGVPLDHDLAARWGWFGPGREWRNLGLSPRFDVTGPLAARMWTALTGQHVDGVMAVDVEALRAVLSATGPVRALGTEADAGNVVELLLHDQYVQFGDDQDRRRDQLGEIAAAAVTALDAGRYDAGRLALALAAAARGRHVLLWSADPRVQQAWVEAGMGGELGPTSLLVSVLNRGGNKLDRFLEVASELDVRAEPGGRRVEVRVRLRNTTPPGEPPYVAGPHPQSGVGAGVYLGIVAVNVPGLAVDVGLDGSPPLVTAGADGPSSVVATPVTLAPGESRSYVVRFRLPGPRAVLRVEPSARIPAMEWRFRTARWRDREARVLSW